MEIEVTGRSCISTPAIVAMCSSSESSGPIFKYAVVGGTAFCHLAVMALFHKDKSAWLQVRLLQV